MISLYIAILTSLFFINIQSELCQNDQILVGNAIFKNYYNPSSTSREHCFTKYISNSSNNNQYSLALSIQSFTINPNLLQSIYIDYSIRGNVKNNQISIILFINDTFPWSQIKASYMVSQIKNLYLGSFITNNFELLPCNSSFNQDWNYQTTSLATAIDKYNFNNRINEQFQAIAFISGIRLQDDIFSIQINNSTFNSYNSQLTVSLNYNSNKNIQFLQLDYIIYQVSYQNIKIQTNFNSFQNNFIALNKISKKSANFQSQNITISFKTDSLQCTGPICKQKSKNCQSSQNCKANGGNIWYSKCIYCQQDQYFYNGQCWNRCLGNFYYDKYSNTCLCQNGFVKIGNDCVIIPNCQNNQILVNNICQCKAGYLQNNYGQCVKMPVCRENQQLFENQCVCVQGYGRNDINGDCLKIPTCNPQYNWQFDRKTFKCVCIAGYQNISNICIQIPKCNINQILINNKCQCKKGLIKINERCEEIPICNKPFQYLSRLQNKCVCQNGYYRNSYNICQNVVSCGPNYYVLNNKCICPSNFIEISNVCTLSCGLNQQYYQGSCKCLPGYYKDYNNICRKCNTNEEMYEGKCSCVKKYYRHNENQSCLPIPQCPQKSIWNQTAYTCDCIYNGQHLINGKCQQCNPNQGWNGSQCVCRSNTYRINNQCVQCNINTFYNGQDCICNPGFYGNKYNCQKCHQSCSKCQGPFSNQCITCADVSYTLNQNGQCSRKSPCPNGLYLDGYNCRSCSKYCNSCNSSSSCSSCIDGFSLQKYDYYNYTCKQVCGDGKRFEQQCDDNNTKNGDGCSQKCVVQFGWICTGGSSVAKSYCYQTNNQYTRTIISPKSAVLLFGRVVHGVRLSYIPKALTENQCENCSKLLWVKVIKSDIVPSVSVSYINETKYQFLIEFNFHGTFSIPVFTFTVQLNPQYSNYFSTQDMSQLQIIKVDPALLAKYDEPDILTLNPIKNKQQQIKIPGQAQKVVFKDNLK